MVNSWFKSSWDWCQSFVVNYLPGFAQSYAQQLYDSYQVITKKDQFIFNELTQRSLVSKEGFAKVDIGFGSLRFATMMVVTGKNYVKSAADYGNWLESNPLLYDSQARAPLKIFQDMMQVETVANQSNEDAFLERKHLKKFINQDETLKFAQNQLVTLFENWQQQQPINSQILAFVNRIFGKSVTGLESVPEETTTLMKKAEDAILNSDNYSKQDFKSISNRLKIVGDQWVEENYQTIKHSENFLTTQASSHDKETFKAMNPLGALIAEGNFTTLLTGAIVMLYNRPDILDSMKTALKSNPQNESQTFNHLVDNYYKECLRYISPNPIVPRYASKEGELKGQGVPSIEIKSRTYLFIPTRAISHSSTLWESPEKFDPSRHDKDSRPNFYPILPFGAGRRICPASSKLVPYIFKTMIEILLKHHDFKIDKPLEPIPTATKSPRFKQNYYLTRCSAKLQFEKPMKPAHKRIQNEALERNVQNKMHRAR